MDIKQLEENVILKIRNGDSNLTKEDYIVIKYSDLLKKEAYYALSKKIIPFSYQLIDIVLPYIVEQDVLSTVPKEINNSFFYEYLKFLIDDGYYAFSIGDMLEQFNVDKETIDRMNELLDNSLNDKSKSFTKIELDINTIIKLLDYKRYDDIKNIRIDYNINNYISSNLYERILKEWPYDEKPDIIIKYEKENDIYNYSINDSFDDLLKSYDEYENSKEKIADVIIKKMEASESLNFLTNNYSLNCFLDELLSNSYSKKIEVAKMLFDRNCLKYANILLKNETITQEEYDDKIQYCIDNNLLIPSEILTNEIEKDYSKYIKYMISTGKINELFIVQNKKNNIYDYSNQQVDYIKENEELIAEQIRSDNPYYDDIRKNIHYNLKKYPLIVLAILDAGKINYLDLTKIDISLLSADIIINMFEKNPRFFMNKNPNATKLFDELIKKLCSEKKYELIISKGLLSKEFVNENEEYFIEQLNDLIFSDLIIEHGFAYVSNNKNVVYKLLQNGLFTEKVIDLINHDEELTYYYNDETLGLIRDYYIKKYNYNPVHFDKIVKTLGPKIIRYLSNNNLINIINLDDETFDKVIGLFPMNEYTMKDLEAGFESLIQYLYGKKNDEDINIFPTMIHAMEDKNQEAIKRIKEKIIIYIKPEFIKKLCEKYHIININNTDDLLNLIIYKYGTDQKEKYLEILHELTKEFILTSRENYRNNHYFDGLYKMHYKFIEKLIEAIDKNDTNNTIVLAATVASKLDNNFYSQLSIRDSLTEDLKNPVNLMNFIVEKIKNPKTRNQYLPILGEAVDYYHKADRNNHLREICLGEELSLSYSLDPKSKTNEVIRSIIEDCEYYYDENNKKISDIIAELLLDKGIDKTLVIDCINYYSGKKAFNNEIPEIQKNMPLVIRTATSYISNHNVYDSHNKPVNIEDLVSKLDKNYKIKRIYTLDNTADPYPILLNLNIDLLKTGLFPDEELYNKLLNIISKKKLHLLPENLKELIAECGLSDDYSDLASFINFFGPILESERNTLESDGKDPNQALSGLVSIINNAGTYSCISSVYSQILGDKDSKLIKSNPKPNSATRKLANNQRLKEAVKLTVENYKRQEITIPAFDTNVSFVSDADDEKKLNVIVGNFTDPCNLTHGERTGACMRIGGVGETLFDFCLKDPNGFHIRFEDPDTHEYISRVSGFRNGNTVFLNELRFSCNKKKYSDMDVVKACRETAKLLIEYSKDSTCPIENVVISNQYAMRETNINETNLNIDNNKEGLSNFYSDVGNRAIILATSAVDQEFVPINFDKSNIPKYKTCRSKPMILTKEKDLIGKINRVASIKTLLSGVDYEDIGRMEFKEGLLCGVVSDDWYIYVDKQKNIHYDYIEIDERAKTELQQYIGVINEIISKTEQDKREIGSDGYGL